MKKIFLPHVRRLPGKKLLLCDNLASHISVEVIDLCRESNVEFVCLPPNSTDKLQPLDVGVFAPMKRKWREQLQKYAERDPAAKLLMKSAFPGMLKELYESLNTKDHLPKAFERCGLYPINRAKVLERIPASMQVAEIAQHMDKQLISKLEIRRFGEGQKKKPRGRKIPAGQSYTQEDSEDEELDEVEETSEEEEVESAADVEEMSEEEEEAAVGEVEEMSELEEEAGREESDREMELGEEELPDLDLDSLHIQPGGHVVAVYEDEWFLCEVCKDQKDVAKGYTKLSYMVIKGKNSFAWGDKVDLHVTLNEDILLRGVVPEPVNSRGHLGLKKTDLKKTLSQLVLVYFL
jgi:hypothetical protein